jgi:HD superfamily phosphodiesterase
MKDRHHHVHEQVEHLYTTSTLPSAHWMWEHHIPFVAAKAEEIAAQVQACIEKTVSAALLHDVADAKMNRNNPQHEAESKALAREILHNATFTDGEIEEIIVQLLGTHSGYANNLPQTLEAKVLATADALGHLSSEFMVSSIAKN